MGNCLAPEAVAEPLPPASGRWVAPKRITALFAAYDTNADGMLSLEEIQAGVSTDIGDGQSALRDHAAAAIPTLYAKGMEQIGKDKAGLDEMRFVRLYASVLFKHFDADQSGYLSREQAEAALAFLSQGKPVAIAIPVHVDGTVRVGAPWFWDMFKLLVQ